MSERRLRAVTAVLALAGLGVASYLSYTRVQHATLMCPTSGCAKVQQSVYSELGGVPVAYLGVAGYALILLSTVRAARVYQLAGAALSSGGAAFALYLLVVQLAVIDAVCLWCLTSDVVLLALVAVSLVRLRSKTRTR